MPAATFTDLGVGAPHREPLAVLSYNLNLQSGLYAEQVMSELNGLHHVTAIAGDPQQNLDFYAGVLGLRLVKKTVNQDAPDTYHLFYADAEGHPGTDLTFFPWPGMGPGRAGPGLASEVSLAVPTGSLGWWADRLARYGSAVEQPRQRFGELVLSLADPHGLRLTLVETDAAREF